MLYFHGNGEVAEDSVELFAEPFATLTDAQRAAVAAWCPPMMQTAGVACDEADLTAETPEPDSEVAQAA